METAALHIHYYNYIMKIGIILTTYDRIDDCLVHLEILKYLPFPYEVIPIWMKKDSPNYFLEEISKYPHAHYCDGISFRTGPLLALISGLKKAKELNLDVVIYRNGDDWLFNNQFVLDNLKQMEKYLMAGYNWLGCNEMYEFALNELYLNVNAFYNTLHSIEVMLEQQTNVLCEFKFAKWARKATQKNIYKIPGREMSPGVGNEDSHLRRLGITDKAVWEERKINNRFFNKKWQLIGSHDNVERKKYYRSIRNDINYHLSLEEEKHFKRWLKESKWNIVGSITDRMFTPIFQPKKIGKLQIIKPK